jgi:hypothetical protein
MFGSYSTAHQVSATPHLKRLERAALLDDLRGLAGGELRRAPGGGPGFRRTDE